MGCVWFVLLHMAGAQKVRRPISLLEPSPRLPSKDAGRLLHAMRAGKVGVSVDFP